MTPRAYRRCRNWASPVFEAPYTWRKVRIKKQRKAGGFNDDILDELLGRKGPSRREIPSRPLSR